MDINATSDGTGQLQEEGIIEGTLITTKRRENYTGVLLNLQLHRVSQCGNDDDLQQRRVLAVCVKLTWPVVIPMLVFMSLTCKLACISTAAARHRFPLLG